MMDSVFFADRLADAVRRKGTPLCVGLDPRWAGGDALRQTVALVDIEDGESLQKGDGLRLVVRLLRAEDVPC